MYLPNSYSQQRQREKPSNIYPVLMAMECEWHRRNGDEVYWNSKVKYGNENKIVYPELMDTQNSVTLVWKEKKIDKLITEPEGLPFLSLPHPDRVFTRAKEYTSGNYKYLPGTHIMAASGCWWGKCSFCVENNYSRGYRWCPQWDIYCTALACSELETYHPKEKCLKEHPQPYEVRPVEDVIREIEECKSLRIREIFDDSATFPTGRWFREFCYAMQKTKLNEKVKFSCNMRLNQLADEYQEFDWLKFYGFRMILVGIESANQKTLDIIGKGILIAGIEQIFKRAAENGLEIHIAVMFGYPWETDEDAIRTLKLVHYLLRKGYAKTAQASFYCPKDGVANEEHRKYIKQIYGVWKYPDFWFNQLKDIKNKDDLKYLWRKIKEGLQWNKPH